MCRYWFHHTVILLTEVVNKVLQPLVKKDAPMDAYRQLFDGILSQRLAPVSYTHLTLPTIYSV